MSYEVTFGDASFKGAEFRASAVTPPGTGERGGRDTTAITIEVWVNSHDDDLPEDARAALFNYSFRPQNQDPHVLTVKVRETTTEGGPALCTYTFQRGWVTTYREYSVLERNQRNIKLYVKFRALVSEDPTSEVSVD